ncbi:Clp protease N-terminal domain-containing protein, partial [Actinomadura roseirufa]|uniref:Clp protease N-terminal domain-containing protein n=1 Tax=Actinomadura roseirufa TaxID=2094049 RepID=UPI0010419505
MPEAIFSLAAYWGDFRAEGMLDGGSTPGWGMASGAEAFAGADVRSEEMFERFTDRARRVVVLAQEEARMLNHNYIGTEH